MNEITIEQRFQRLNSLAHELCAKKTNPKMARAGDLNGRTKINSQIAGSVVYLISQLPKELPRFFVANRLAHQYNVSLRQARRIVYGSRTGKLLPHARLNELRKSLLTSAEKYGYSYGPVGVALSRAARNGNTGVWSRIKKAGLRGVYKFLKQTTEMKDIGISSTFAEHVLRKEALRHEAA